MPAAGLVVNDVSKSYGAVRVLSGVSLQAPVGTITGLLGPNGAGKTTLFRILMGLTPADGGSATMEGGEILHLPVHRKAGAGLGYLPQESASFPELSVSDNLLAVLELVEPDKAKRAERLPELLALGGVAGIADRRYGALSGGERRRVEVAKTFATKPRLLLLDEPFSGLDPLIIEDLTRLLRSVADRGIGVLLTDHNVHMALGMVDQAFLLANGTVLCSGSPDEIIANDDAKRAYLGETFGA